MRLSLWIHVLLVGNSFGRRSSGDSSVSDSGRIIDENNNNNNNNNQRQRRRRLEEEEIRLYERHKNDAICLEETVGFLPTWTTTTTTSASSSITTTSSPPNCSCRSSDRLDCTADVIINSSSPQQQAGGTRTGTTTTTTTQVSREKSWTRVQIPKKKDTYLTWPVSSVTCSKLALISGDSDDGAVALPEDGKLRQQQQRRLRRRRRTTTSIQEDLRKSRLHLQEEEQDTSTFFEARLTVQFGIPSLDDSRQPVSTCLASVQDKTCSACRLCNATSSPERIEVDCSNLDWQQRGGRWPSVTATTTTTTSTVFPSLSSDGCVKPTEWVISVAADAAATAIAAETVADAAAADLVNPFNEE